ncbi:hypothetical protein GCM10027176_39150 [Actinoallomurus bryophytorum]|uniref:Uncharacterized protein n=1 Tax=Actinoallomurus bryophytorum TaxID=1490222 RepID=A0A543CWB7_9ACTN|nr:DUF6412 domain-containing protein [Actinoallomurus bryophytorum]TQM01390.1 hypothetical protein FB559_7148 [Actinoallomurus bryophytorum]
MTRILAVTVTALIASWNAADALTPSTVLLAAAALAVAGLVILAARRPAASVAPGVPAGHASLRERAGRTVFIRLRDPDAAGRPRPRAPSALARAAHA